MAVVIQDTFTDTDTTSLGSHSPDTGDAWEALGFGTAGGALGSDLQILSNRCQALDVSDRGTVYRQSTDPGADDYDVTATMTFRASGQVNRYTEIAVRMTATGTINSAVNRYFVFADNNAQSWSLYKVVSGTLTQLDTAGAALAGNTFAVKVEVRSSAPTVRVLIDDVETLTTNDTDITQRGRVGVGASRGDSTQFLDTLSVDNLLSAGGGNATTVAGLLNLLAGTSGLTETGAANALAGTQGLTLAGALNAHAATSDLTETGAANAAAGTTGLTLVGALRTLAGV